MLAAGAGNAAGALAFGQPSLPGGSGHGSSGQLPSLADLHRLNMTNIMNMMHRKVFSFLDNMPSIRFLFATWPFSLNILKLGEG